MVRKVGKSGSCSWFISGPPGYPQWGNVPTLEVSDNMRLIAGMLGKEGGIGAGSGAHRLYGDHLQILVEAETLERRSPPEVVFEEGGGGPSRHSDSGRFLSPPERPRLGR